MTASSLIFVVVLAVWAAYMLQHWVRRREDLATARSVDRFSEAMRMLERRTPVKADIAKPPEEPKRVVRGAQTIVKRVSVKGSSRAGATAFDAPADSAASGSTSSEAAASVPARAARPSFSSPEVKAGALLASLVLFALTTVLAPFGAVPGWMPLIGVAAVGGVVVWLRRSVLTARTHGQSTPAARVKPERSATAKPVAETKLGQPAATPSGAPKRLPLVAERPVETANSKAVEGDVVFDQEPNGARAKRAEAEVFDGRRWAPVEVPRPTYTLKAKAEREEVAPAATIDEAETRTAAVPAEQLDARPLAARYENTPVEELPFDGMALDEDYDELPQVFRAG